MARVVASQGSGQEALWMSTLQVASQSWIAFDWDSRLTQLVNAVTQAREQKDQSLAARKTLAETTKLFKRSVKSMEQASGGLAENPSSEEHVGNAVKSMDSLAKECRKTVKAYQEEIDNLTRRCKASETAFFSIHQGLSEVPDPSSLLAAALEQIHSQQTQIAQLLRTVDEVNREMANMETNYSQQTSRYQKEIYQLEEAKTGEASSGGLSKADREELVQLRREVAEYEVEFRSLKNQDITIRKLEAKIAELQTAGEEELMKSLEKVRQDLAETEGRRAAEALEREAAMERKAQSLELELKAERAGREATQAHLLQADEGAGEREAAWEAQRRILVDDAERLRVTLHEATRERDSLRLRVAATGGGSDRTGPTPPPSASVSMADMILERKAYEAEVTYVF
jgi:homeobox protein cut-like